MHKKRRSERAAKPALSLESPRNRFQVGEEFDVTIEKLAWGGSGIARTDRGVVFVDFAAPGDQITIRIQSVENDYARASIAKIGTPSPDRITPRCPAFGRCGGCDWQHLSLESQHRLKKELLQETLRKIELPQGIAFVASPHSWNYRNRIQVNVGNSGVFYHAKRSHAPVEIDHCDIAEADINRQITSMNSRPSDLPPGRIQLKSNTPAESDIQEPLSFEFAQVNTAMNEVLVKSVLDLARQTEFARFFDLYSGSGNFSFPLSEAFPQAPGVAVELNPLSVRSAQEEIRRRRWSKSRLEFFAASVDALIERLPIDANSFVLLDPPRAGLSKKVAAVLAKTQARRILYISCNPPGLARDLQRLESLGRWKTQRVVAFDMFPQTGHLEVMAELCPVSSSPAFVDRQG